MWYDQQMPGMVLRLLFEFSLNDRRRWKPKQSSVTMSKHAVASTQKHIISEIRFRTPRDWIYRVRQNMIQEALTIR